MSERTPHAVEREQRRSILLQNLFEIATLRGAVTLSHLYPAEDRIKASDILLREYRHEDEDELMRELAGYGRKK